MQKQVHKLSACPSCQLSAALKQHICPHHPTGVRGHHISAGPELSLETNLMAWDNLGVQASDAKGQHNISWLLK